MRLRHVPAVLVAVGGLLVGLPGTAFASDYCYGSADYPVATGDAIGATISGSATGYCTTTMSLIEVNVRLYNNLLLVASHTESVHSTSSVTGSVTTACQPGLWETRATITYTVVPGTWITQDVSSGIEVVVCGTP